MAPTPGRRTAPPLVLALALLVAAALSLAACGSSEEGLDVVEGEPVELGDLTYNVVFSRFLNPADTEDSAYVTGQPLPPPGSSYFGVFIQVENNSDEQAQDLPEALTITDITGAEYESIPSESLYALHLGTRVGPEDQLPALDSTPQQGPIQGSLVLFEIPDGATENRPLVLEIPGPGGEAAEVTLDL
jgi:hypothetical protein